MIVLDTSDVGTSGFLTVPFGHFTPWCHAEQCAAWTERVLVPQVTQRRCDLVVSSILQHEPNLRWQAFVHRHTSRW